MAYGITHNDRRGLVDVSLLICAFADPRALSRYTPRPGIPDNGQDLAQGRRVARRRAAGRLDGRGRRRGVAWP